MRVGGFYCVAIGAACLLGACHHATFDTPPSFGQLPEHEAYEQRAASAHGVVIAVRDVELEEPASLTFWSEAVQQRLGAGQGYALLGTRDVRAKSGHRGRLLAFGRDQHGHTYDYWVVLFPVKKHLYVVEAGGRRDRFEPTRKDLDKAVQSLSLP